MVAATASIGPLLVTLIRQYAVPSRPSSPAGLVLAHGPTPPGPHRDACALPQISLLTVMCGWHAGPAATGSVTVLEVSVPAGSDPPAVLDTEVTEQVAVGTVWKHNCGGSPWNVT